MRRHTFYHEIKIVFADPFNDITIYKLDSTDKSISNSFPVVKLDFELLEPNTEGFGIIDSILHVDGAGRQYLHQKAGGSVKLTSPLR